MGRTLVSTSQGFGMSAPLLILSGGVEGPNVSAFGEVCCFGIAAMRTSSAFCGELLSLNQNH